MININFFFRLWQISSVVKGLMNIVCKNSKRMALLHLSHFLSAMLVFFFPRLFYFSDYFFLLFISTNISRQNWFQSTTVFWLEISKTFLGISTAGPRPLPIASGCCKQCSPHWLLEEGGESVIAPKKNIHFFFPRVNHFI